MTVIDEKAAAPAGTNGRGAYIDEDRSVSIYRAEPSGYELNYKNGDRVTRILLSEEGALATLVLLNDWFDRQPTEA